MSGPAGSLQEALARGLAQPWFEPYADPAQRLAASLRAGQDLLQALGEARDRQPAIVLPAGPLCFVESAELPPGQPYEAFIAQTARVPTRRNVHDLFNALVWLRFPVLKARLNALQAEEIARCGIGPSRGALRDALTLFDENGALWAAPPALAQALAARDWQTLFIAERPLWQGAVPLLFGHALLEKLLTPRKGITAHVWLLPPGAGIDEAAHGLWASKTAAQAARLPLPVLGVPGWWPGNESPGFYDDPAVFRPLPR